MKTKFLTTLAVAGLASAAFGQGVILDNNGNTGNQASAGNGLVYNSDGSLFDGSLYNLGVGVYTSSTGLAGSYTLLSIFTPTTDSKGYTGLDLGTFQLGAGAVSINIPGVTPGALAFFEFQVWSGANFGAGELAGSYAAALAALNPTADVFFSQATSNPNAGPPIPASNLTSMPSFTLTPVPEPTTLALAGLGGLASLVMLRRKQA